MNSSANLSQKKAIEHFDGPVLIIAGPGSGKTFTLVERVVALIEAGKATAETLLVVTFTEKAAQELTTRISNRLLSAGLSFNVNEMYVGTFHSLCLRVLKDHSEFTRLKRSFNLLDQFDQQYFLYQRLKEFKGIDGITELIGEDRSGRWYQSTQLLKWLNKVTEETLDIKALKGSEHASLQALAECFATYQRLLEEANTLDFSGIQFEALRLLRDNPGVLESLKSKFSHLMVDEYQDTNTIQEQILFLLAGDTKNLCVVGDDDQGLYRFRGATIRNILEYPSNFAKGECEQVSLTVNYRSDPKIIDFYNSWIADEEWSDEDAHYRYDKVIEPRPDDFADVSSVLKITQTDDNDFQGEVYEFLRHLEASGELTDWNQVAFLFRSVKNDKVLALARHLEANGIPVYSPRSNLYFEREEIRLMIGALIFLFPQFADVRQERADLEMRVWEYYDEQCFKLFVQELRKPENKRLLEWARPLAKRHLNLTADADYAFSGLFYQLLQFPLFSRFLEEDQLTGVDKGRAARNLATFSQLLVKFEYLHYITVLNPRFLDQNIRDLFNRYLKFLHEGGINEYEDDSEYAPSGCVSFLTIHQSKGLEFPIVICGSLEATPRKQWTDIDELLEPFLNKPPFEPMERTKFFDFRRLYYTAFSRAQNLLVLATEVKEGRGRSPSRYFDDFFHDLPHWRDPKFVVENFDFEQVKDVNLKREYSFTSHITLFENCAEQYRFFKELEFQPIRAGAQLFGTLVHQTIEDVHKAVLRGEPHLVTEDQIKGWFDTNYHYLSKRERQYLAPPSLRAAHGHVERYVDRERKNFDRLKEAEVDISLVKDSYILKGSVDLIRGENGTVELIDFKSERKPDMEKDRSRLRQYQRQLEVYAHLVEERTGEKVSKTHLYYTGEQDSNPFISFEKDGKAIGKTIASFDAVVDRIEGRDYAIKERPAKLCENCDMRAYCDMKNWNFKAGGA